MKYSVTLFALFGLISLGAAVPKYEPYYDPNLMWPSDEPYEWCAKTVTCNDDSDCYDSTCMDVAKGRQNLITCGSLPWWPHSCWSWVPSSPKSAADA